MATVRLGAKVRALRQRAGLSQAALARQVGISPSYLNLIEHDRRSLSAPMLIKVAQILNVDLQTFDTATNAQQLADIEAALRDTVFDDQPWTEAELSEVSELTSVAPAFCESFLRLYGAYQDVRASAANLAARLSEHWALPGIDRSRLPTEEVSAFIDAHHNHFPELEAAAADLRERAGLRQEDLLGAMIRFLAHELGVRTEFVPADRDRGAVRRYEPERKVLWLSQSLPPGSRVFQAAHQIGLLTLQLVLERLAQKDSHLSNDESRALCRVVLANYFAGAVVMPYEDFIEAAREQRHDVELLQNRFGANFEMVCHRLTTLQRPGAEGVPFHFVRVDIAGNISKRFSASGFAIPQHGSSCPRWHVHNAFLTPGRITVQLSRTSDGRAWFSIARTVERAARGYHVPRSIQAITLGCDVEHARQLVYADHVDVERLDAAVPVGTTCRLCQQPDCDQRVLPPIEQPLHIQEHIRGHSFFNPFRG